MTGTFDAAGERFLLKGYLRAVKNKFQAHRIIRVDNEELVFHVDFLNERNPGEELDLVGGRGKLQSIYTDAMKAVFKYEGYSTHPEFTIAKNGHLSRISRERAAEFLCS